MTHTKGFLTIYRLKRYAFTLGITAEVLSDNAWMLHLLPLFKFADKNGCRNLGVNSLLPWWSQAQMSITRVIPFASNKFCKLNLQLIRRARNMTNHWMSWTVMLMWKCRRSLTSWKVPIQQTPEDSDLLSSFARLPKFPSSNQQSRIWICSCHFSWSAP